MWKSGAGFPLSRHSHCMRWTQSNPVALGDEHKPLAWPQIVRERFRGDKIQGVFRGNVPERRSRLDRDIQIIHIEVLMMRGIFVKDDQGFFRRLRDRKSVV